MIKVKLEKGHDQKFDAALKRLKKGVKKETQTIIAKAALVAESVAARNAPVGTPESTGIKGYLGGTLRQSIRHEIDPSGLRAFVLSDVEYAPYQNYGTRFIRGKFFMEKGIFAAQKRVIRQARKK